jgi:hypothetical protein
MAGIVLHLEDFKISSLTMLCLSLMDEIPSSLSSMIHVAMPNIFGLMNSHCVHWVSGFAICLLRVAESLLKVASSSLYFVACDGIGAVCFY